MERQSFIFYIEWRDALAGCSEEVRLEVYDAIVEYAASRILPKDISPIARIAFMFIKNDIDKNTPQNFGSFHWNWKGGITSENIKQRNSALYKKWRKSVLERDGYTCCKCGESTNLQVHHIVRFCDDPELRFDIDNGLTLCKECHKKIHKRKT
jgi:hypothetical protein